MRLYGCSPGSFSNMYRTPRKKGAVSVLPDPQPDSQSYARTSHKIEKSAACLLQQEPADFFVFLMIAVMLRRKVRNPVSIHIHGRRAAAPVADILGLERLFLRALFLRSRKNKVLDLLGMADMF